MTLDDILGFIGKGLSLNLNVDGKIDKVETR